uniref:Uncharacterized protein n=1 Tax=Rhizophora mucronata TaxID=61149 RepID=A0A2P2PDJ8_RHIMU
MEREETEKKGKKGQKIIIELLPV